MTNTIKKRSKKKVEDQMFKFIFYSVIYAIFMGLIYGTVQMNLGTQHFIGFVYMSWEQTFLILGFAGWTILALFIFKKGKFNLR